MEETLMSKIQKWAWFNLTVIALTAICVIALIPVLGKGAMGGFGILGLMGFGVLLCRKKAGEVVMDERDTAIQLKSGRIAFSVFWIAFVIAGVAVSSYYEESGMVPVLLIQAALWCGFMLLSAVQAIATLVQYDRR